MSNNSVKYYATLFIIFIGMYFLCLYHSVFLLMRSYWSFLLIDNFVILFAVFVDPYAMFVITLHSLLCFYHSLCLFVHLFILSFEPFVLHSLFVHIVWSFVSFEHSSYYYFVLTIWMISTFVVSIHSFHFLSLLCGLLFHIIIVSIYTFILYVHSRNRSVTHFFLGYWLQGGYSY